MSSREQTRNCQEWVAVLRRMEAIDWDLQVSPGAARLARIVFSYLNRASRKAWPSQGRLALDLGCSERTIRNQLDELEKRGHIRIEAYRGRGLTNLISFLPASKDDLAAVKKRGNRLPPKTPNKQENNCRPTAQKPENPRPENRKLISDRTLLNNFPEVESGPTGGVGKEAGLLWADIGEPQSFEEFEAETIEMLRPGYRRIEVEVDPSQIDLSRI